MSQEAQGQILCYWLFGFWKSSVSVRGHGHGCPGLLGLASLGQGCRWKPRESPRHIGTVIPGDDGNNASGDGCSSSCDVEIGALPAASHFGVRT